MMTERPPGGRRLTVVEWRLYVVAALAAIYALVWRAIDQPAASGGDLARAPAKGPAPPAPATVWLDELPVAQRPAIAAPAGWTVIDRGATPAPPAPVERPRIVRASASRPLRVRTRSS